MTIHEDLRTTPSTKTQIESLGGTLVFLSKPSRSRHSRLRSNTSLASFGRNLLAVTKTTQVNSIGPSIDWRGNPTHLELATVSQGEFALLDKQYLSWVQDRELSLDDTRVVPTEDGGFHVWACTWSTCDPRATTNQVRITLDSNLEVTDQFFPAIGTNQGVGHEKNWIPHAGTNLLTYSLAPKHVLYDLETKEKHVSRGLSWSLGEPHGSSPSIVVGEERVALFHSSFLWDGDLGGFEAGLHLSSSRYAVGVYSFSPNPPHNILRFSSRPLLVSSAEDPLVVGSVLVIFPSGLILEKETVVISMGINECASALARIPLATLLAALDSEVGEATSARKFPAPKIEGQPRRGNVKL